MKKAFIGVFLLILCLIPQMRQEKPWVWYAPIFNSDHTTDSDTVYDIDYYRERFQALGITVVGVDIGNSRGGAEGQEAMDEFYEEMVAGGYSPKPILLGQSRGGLMLTSWAVRNPEKVGGFVGLYPVLSLTDWPMRTDRANTLADYGVDAKHIGEYSPIHKLDEMDFPMHIIHGDSDTVVHFEDNVGLLENDNLKLVVVPGGGHDITPPFLQNEGVIDFVLDNK